MSLATESAPSERAEASAHEVAGFLVVACGPDGRVDVAEGVGLARFGLAEGTLLGRDAEEAFARWPVLAQAIQGAIRGISSFVTLRFPDAMLAVRLEHRQGAGGAVLGGAAVPLAGSIPLEEDRRLRRVFEQMPGAIWATDRQLRVTNSAGRVKPLSDLSTHLVVGSTVMDVVGTSDPSEPAIAHHLLALAGQRTRFRYPFRDRLFDMLVEPLYEGDAVVGTVGLAIDVTSQVRTRETLERREAELRDAQAIAHVGSWEWNLSDDTVRWSAELNAIFGLPSGVCEGSYEAFLGQAVDGDRDRLEAAMLESIRSSQPFELEHRISRPDGSERILLTRGAVLTGPSGEARMIGTGLDITERSEAARKLEHNLSVLQATLEATSDGMLVVDRSRRVVAYNTAFLRMWDIPTPREPHPLDRELLSAIDRQLEAPTQFRAGVEAIYASPESTSTETIRLADGRTFERASFPQRIGAEVVGRVWTFRDVTERERLLRRTMFLSDASRLLASLEAERALEAVGRLALPLLGDCSAIDLFEEDGSTRRIASACLVPGREVEPRLPRSVHAGHSSAAFERGRASLTVPLLAHGEAIGALSFGAPPGRRYGSDDLHLAEELARRASLALENARLYREAQRALRTREEFLAVVAHEIRGPVTATHLATQALQREGLSPELRAQALAVIAREDRRIARFVEELLELGRIHAGRLHLTYERVDLVAVAREVVARLGPELTRSGSTLDVRTDPEVAGTWDRTRVDQLVTNLLSNAIKYGQGKPITLAVSAVDGLARVEVRDRGIGIAPELQEKIFLPFERAVSARNFGGLGLGLYIVKMIAEGLGGQVRVESQVGAGSTFTAELPLDRREDGDR